MLYLTDFYLAANVVNVCTEIQIHSPVIVSSNIKDEFELENVL